MCDGGLLWEIDENGIRTDYAYDTARQLVEDVYKRQLLTPKHQTYLEGCYRGTHKDSIPLLQRWDRG